VARDVTGAGPRPARLERIVVEHVSLRLGAHWALRDVSLELRAGERWLLQGPNGAGKTVLLKLLRGDLWPTPTGREARRYHLRGGEVLSQPLFAADRIAYLGPERQDRYERHESTLDVAQVVLTGYDDSDLPLQPATAAQRRRIHDVLRQVGLAGIVSRRFRTLSYGQRRRVLLARAVVRRPDVLLLDEALNGLDERGRLAFARALRRVTTPRTAWILSTHRPAEARVGFAPTHRVTMEAGRLQEQMDLRQAPRQRAGRSLVTARRGDERRRQPTRDTHPRSSSSRQGPATLLRLERAAVFRDGQPVIGRFDWSLRMGEHWSVRGANGAGKSTFMAVLYGDLWPAHGGSRVRRWTAAEDWKARVGLLSPELQAAYAATGCTVAEIVTSGLHASIGLNDWPTAAERRRVQRELAAWGLQTLAGRKARELSYGQLRRALAARAFIRSRRLYLLDEPFDGLDAATRALLSERIARAVRAGATLVVATHHDADVPPCVRRELRLRRGRAPVAGFRDVAADGRAGD
jgi:molybdate transport system ATP-binding protein